MGMYTGLRCKVKLKDKFIPMIETMITNHSWANLGYDFTDKFNKDSRAIFIPFGALEYMPWNEDDPEWENRVENGIWTFQCSLKDYEDTIRNFFDTILSNIAESSYYIEKLYEEWDISTIYEISDDKVLNKGKGVWYK